MVLDCHAMWRRSVTIIASLHARLQIELMLSAGSAVAVPVPVPVAVGRTSLAQLESSYTDNPM